MQATASKLLGSEHPDVVQARRTSEALKQDVRQLGSVPLRKPLLRPETPAYINLQTQVNSTTSSMEALQATRTAVKRKCQDYAARLERTLEMEHEYLLLTRGGS